jgi:putative acetyltransferase
MKIRVDDLLGPEIAGLLEDHIRDMRAISPPESKHALDLSGLRKPEITFWTIWEEGTLAGCGALKQLDLLHGEVKSMRTVSSFRGKGVASQVLNQIIAEARRRGYRGLSLETGSMEFFEPARRLYGKFGFSPCGPFGAYQADPNSCFFTLSL